MAKNFNEDPTSNIYKSSGGYIPPAPPSMWFGVPKEFFEKIAPSIITGEPNTADPTVYNEKHAALNNGQSIREDMNIPLFLIDPNDNSLKKNPVAPDPIFTCKSKGWGELYEGYGGDEGKLGVAGTTAEQLNELDLADISPDANPATTAARRALTNAIMSMYANEEFYLYLLVCSQYSTTTLYQQNRCGWLSIGTLYS